MKYVYLLLKKKSSFCVIFVYYNCIIIIIFLGILLSDLTELPSMKIGDYTLQFELGPVSAEIQEVARKELRESPELQKESMERLKELLTGELKITKPVIYSVWVKNIIVSS